MSENVLKPQRSTTQSACVRLLSSALIACAALRCIAARPASGGFPPAATKHWTADNGNGTYSNPLFYEEFEDPDIIRVGEDYYLVGTTMHMNPALQIMHSKDLVNWELVGYCMDRLDFGPTCRLEGGDIYGKGIWAPCIRYHQGTFYIFSNINGLGLQVFRSKSIKGPWERSQLPGRHDLSVLFDEDLGKIFIIHGNSAPYPIEELEPDLKSFVTAAPKRSLPERMGEGHHLYKIDGKYVDVSAIPGGPVDQMVAVAGSIDGPWKVTRMVQGESLGVTQATPARASANDRGLWIHQGGICDTPSGEWWGIIMSDHGSAGRMVNLVPITWQNNVLVNVAADTAGGVLQNAKVQILDLGKGRVALKAVNGRLVSASGEAVVLKNLSGGNLGEAESFQWVNLMRGDAMLMSLANHRYLATKPNEPDPSRFRPPARARPARMALAVNGR